MITTFNEKETKIIPVWTKEVIIKTLFMFFSCESVINFLPHWHDTLFYSLRVDIITGIILP